MRRMATSRSLLWLCLSSVVVSALSQSPACHTYTSSGIITPTTPALNVAIMVPDAFLVGDASVTVDLSHRRVGALKVSLSAQPVQGGASGQTIVLKDRSLGRKGNNLYQTTFSDHSTRSFPIAADGAPFSGTFRPTQKLAFLYQGGTSTTAGHGGSQGAWVLHVEDVAPNATRREIALNDWSLVLCERAAPNTVQAQAPAAAPVPVPVPVPAATPSVAQAPVPAPAAGLGQVAPPPVTSYSGPADPSLPPLQQAPATAAAPVENWFGWSVVTKSEAPGAESTLPPVELAPATAAPAAVMAPRAPLSTIRASINSHVQQRYGACADGGCQNAQNQIWRAVILGLYAHTFAEAHGNARHDFQDLLDKLQEVLPGDNPKISKLDDWVQGHKEQVQQIGAALKEQFGGQLAKLGINDGESGPVRQFLEGLGGDAGSRPMQQLLASFRDGTADGPLQALLLRARDAAGGGGGGDGLGALSNLFSQDGAGTHLEDLFGGMGGMQDVMSQFLGQK